MVSSGLREVWMQVLQLLTLVLAPPLLPLPLLGRHLPMHPCTYYRYDVTLSLHALWTRAPLAWVPGAIICPASIIFTFGGDLGC